MSAILGETGTTVPSKVTLAKTIRLLSMLRTLIHSPGRPSCNACPIVVTAKPIPSIFIVTFWLRRMTMAETFALTIPDRMVRPTGMT